MPFGLLAPWMLWVAAIVIPPLVLLYFLRLRRRPESVSSTFLWRRAVQDLQVNAPFQRLRRNLLLLLQLLVLALGVFALARPIVESTLTSEPSVVILIDRSASMNTVEEDGRTRFDRAREQARRLVRTFNQTGSRWLSLFSGVESLTRVMVIAYADRATVVSPFTTSMADVLDRIDQIEPTDGPTNLAEGLALAEAYMMQTRLEQSTESTEQASSIVLISDGAVPDLRDQVLRADRLRLIPIGAAIDNVGITSLRIQRNYERPEELSTFIQVTNFGDKPITTDLSILIDNRLVTVQEVTLAARPVARDDNAAVSETANVWQKGLTLTVPGQGLLQARLARRDALAADNAASIQVPAPRKLHVLLVSEKNWFLEKALAPLPLERLDALTPAQYEAAADDRLLADGKSIYDLVVFDKHNTDRLPAGNYLFIYAVPGLPGVGVKGEVGEHAMLWWDETHPVLRYVALDYLYAGKGLELELPERAQHLIEGPHGPVLARVLDEGRQCLILGFPIEVSTWWRNLPSLGVFIYNATRFLGSGGALAEQGSFRPGDALRIQLPAGVREAQLDRPDGSRDLVRADLSGVARYAGTDRVGLYQVPTGIPGRNRFPVNLEDPRESDITVRTDLDLGGVQVEVGDQIRNATPEIWRWFVGAALLFALVEWYIYNQRVMI